FWLDRSRTAPISRHTNAFKINEDVVIPLERLGDYTDGVERMNIEMSIRNKLKLVDRLLDFFADPDAEHLWRPGSEARPTDEDLATALADARDIVAVVRAHWRHLYDHLDATFRDLQSRAIVVSWKKDIRAPLEGVFARRLFDALLARWPGLH